MDIAYFLKKSVTNRFPDFPRAFNSPAPNLAVPNLFCGPLATRSGGGVMPPMLACGRGFAPQTYKFYLSPRPGLPGKLRKSRTSFARGGPRGDLATGELAGPRGCR